jgi:hypothetical protein
LAVSKLIDKERVKLHQTAVTSKHLDKMQELLKKFFETFTITAV